MDRNDESLSSNENNWKDAPYESRIMPSDLPAAVAIEIKPFPPKSLPKKNIFSNSFFFLCGILLPCVSLGVELMTRMCAEEFFDPLPTIWHVFLVAFVPASNVFLWNAVRCDWGEYRSLLGLTNGVTIGIATFYTLVYLPLLPLSLVALIFFGLGFLPLTPVLALVASIVGRRQLRDFGAPETKLRLWPGLALGLLAVVVTEIPATVTRIGLQMASSPDMAQSNRGVKWLRSFGNKELMLRSCYQEQRAMSDLVSTVVAFGDPVSTDEAKTIYYRVTGTPFNAEKPPANIKVNRWDWRNEFEFDANTGGEIVAGQLKGLSLLNSRQDQSIDANAAVSYTEWTLVFKNISTQQREARAQIALPPGGVVSRLTLWINGEERDAAFGGRGQVREAYQQVAVVQRRDPVLVTTTGIDRVLMQCFPIQPDGGEMKVRLGITAPLQLESNAQATLPLPYIIERNFGVDEKARHYVWVESKQPLAAANFDGLKPEQTEAGKFALRGHVADAKLADGFIRATRTTNASEAWTVDPRSKNADIIKQAIAAQPIPAPSRVMFVVDGSRQMKDVRQQFAETLTQLPDDIEVGLLLASDGWVDLSGGVKKNSATMRHEFSRLVQNANYEGGHDNVPALLQSWDVAAEKPNSAMIWVHGAQPVQLQSLDELQQRYERRPDGPRLYDLQLITGPNRLAENFSKLKAVEPIPNRLHGLAQLFAQWKGTASRQVVSREKRKRAGWQRNDAIETSSHLARLWANDEVKRLLSLRDKTEEATTLAVNYQLVTPVSGAVVLETKEQYERANLAPVNPSSVPTIPEPEEWLLLAIVGAILLYLLAQKRFGSVRLRV